VGVVGGSDLAKITEQLGKTGLFCYSWISQKLKNNGKRDYRE
jgi:hypothetical protein